MTPREKSWLRNIQALQLHTDNPYQDDYYYVVCAIKVVGSVERARWLVYVLYVWCLFWCRERLGFIAFVGLARELEKLSKIEIHF